MKGIILAAGRGSRMGEHTARNPKCLVELGGRPLLFWQLAALREAGVSDIAVVCGYKGEQLIELSAREGGFTCVMNPRWESGNMVSSLLCATAWAQGDECVVSYSDILYPADHARALLACREPLALTYDTLWEKLWSLRFADPLDDAETFREQSGLLREIGGKTRDPADIQGQYMGLFRLRPEGWRAVEALCSRQGVEVEKLDVTSMLRLLLERGLPIGAVPVAGRWCEVDNGDDLALYRRLLAEGGGWSHDWRGAR